ncbi:laccase, multicopper oxidase, benzenediol:oxygen oxidorectuctase, partial [Elasticomyces elasticus]
GSSPWGGISTQNSNPYTSAPRRGVQTRSYHLTLAECDIKPDGVVTQNTICVNGQFPGPLISANYGDTLSITATNKLKDEGTAMRCDKFWMRSNIVVCSINDGVLTEALAVIYYQGADTKTLPAVAPNQGPAASTSPMSCGNDPLTSTIPTFPIAVAKPNVTNELAISLKSNGTHMLYTMNNVSFRADFNVPLINHAFDSTLRNLPAKRNIWNLGTATEVRVVIYNWNDAPHPIYLHGHNMQVLNLGM